jgi:hypothetical protein
MTATAVLFFLTPASFAQTRTDWHFWAAADGLKESYSRTMSIGADGCLYIRHGAVTSRTVMDGYNVVQTPEARRGTAIVWSRWARI